jgi:hypothetical protein
MNKAYLLVTALFVLNCTEKEKKANSTTAQVDTSWQYAQHLIKGKIKPSDNPQTLAWLDSLQSPKIRTRQLAFKVYLALAPQSDGALGEYVSESTYRYFGTHSPEFWQVYLLGNKSDRKQLEFHLAAGLYFNSIETSVALKNYFDAVEQKSGLRIDRAFKESIRKQLLKITS